MQPARFRYPAKGTDYPIAFTYKDSSDVGVSIDGAPTAGWTFVNRGMLRLDTAPTGVVCVYSKSQAPMDDTREALGLDPTDGIHFDARNAQLHNLADPTNATDAATKGYVDAAVAAAGQQLKEELINYLVGTIEKLVAPQGETNGGPK